MIVCPNCGKENQDHYKFCLGCGSDLPRSEGEEKARPTPTPPTGIPAVSDDAGYSPTQVVDSSAGEAPTEVAPPEPEIEPEPVADPEPEPVADPEPEPVADPEPEPEPEYVPEPRPTTPPSGAEEGTGAGISCGTCGSKIADGFAFCGACGTSVPGAQTAAPAMPQTTSTGGARLVLIQPDGTEGGHVDIPDSEVAIGRDAGGFFASDPFLSPTHATFFLDGSEVVIKDADSLNGVFIKIQPNEPAEIRSGDVFRMGQELILFEEIDRGNTASDGTEKMGSPIEGLWGRVALIVGQGRLGNAFPIGGDGIIFGRERGNILFPEDGYVSGMHLKLYTENNRFYLNDLGSSNGTFSKVADSQRLSSGSFILMGQQLFRVDI
ncbi:MAG: FHA domain-containing protein [Deltaproteobacteria bacterium]|nr:FHA domain-containing protein [Deltaproteobacteria bacterium]